MIDPLVSMVMGIALGATCVGVPAFMALREYGTALETERTHSTDLRLQLTSKTPGEYAEVKAIAQTWQPEDRPTIPKTRWAYDPTGIIGVEVPLDDDDG